MTERQRDQSEVETSVAFCAHADWGLNPHPFCVWDNAPKQLSHPSSAGGNVLICHTKAIHDPQTIFIS